MVLLLWESRSSPILIKPFIKNNEGLFLWRNYYICGKYCKKAMKRSVARLLGFIGLCINLAYILINRFVTPLSHWIFGLILGIVFILILIGLLGQKYGKE